MNAIANITYEFDEKNGNGANIATAEILDTDTWDEYGTFTLPISNPIPEYYSDNMTDSDMETWVAIARCSIIVQLLAVTLITRSVTVSATASRTSPSKKTTLASSTLSLK